MMRFNGTASASRLWRKGYRVAPVVSPEVPIGPAPYAPSGLAVFGTVYDRAAFVLAAREVGCNYFVGFRDVNGYGLSYAYAIWVGPGVYLKDVSTPPGTEDLSLQRRVVRDVADARDAERNSARAKAEEHLATDGAGDGPLRLYEVYEESAARHRALAIRTCFTRQDPRETARAGEDRT